MFIILCPNDITFMCHRDSKNKDSFSNVLPPAKSLSVSVEKYNK